MPETFRIREAHVEAFRAGRLKDFERRATAYLRARFPEATAPLSDDRMGSRVREGVSRASAYGLTTERHVMAFLSAMFLSGEHFDAEPDGWARSVLDGPDLDASDKATLLLLAADARARAASDRGADDMAGA